jgi:hypothetical protein
MKKIGPIAGVRRVAVIRSVVTGSRREFRGWDKPDVREGGQRRQCGFSVASASQQLASVILNSVGFVNQRLPTCFAATCKDFTSALCCMMS